MANVTCAAAHLSAEEVAHRWKHDPRPHRRQRWLIIYQAPVDPRTAEQIAKHCGVSKKRCISSSRPTTDEAWPQWRHPGWLWGTAP